jgi:hypothetical protein
VPGRSPMTPDEQAANAEKRAKEASIMREVKAAYEKELGHSVDFGVDEERREFDRRINEANKEN